MIKITYVYVLDVDHLKTERRVIVHSLNWNELHHPALLQTAAKNSCEEIQLSFVRPKDNPDNWSGSVRCYNINST